MRIARILTRLNLGGPARQALASDPLLVERGHTLRLFTGRPEGGEGDLFDEYRERGLDVVRVPGLGRGPSLGDLRARRFLTRALGEFAPHVLHTHASKAGTLGRWAARRAVLSGGGISRDQETGDRTGGTHGTPVAQRIRTVHTFHGHVLEGYFPPLVSRWLVAHETRLARHTDRIVAVSHATAEDLMRLGVVEESRLVVVPPGVDLAPLLALDRNRGDRNAQGAPGVLRELVGASPETQLVGVVGRLSEVKRPELALEVFEILATAHPRLQLVFVGDGGERRALERRIRAGSSAMQERVHMVGAQANMVDVFADLDAVLLTSRSEGLPVALIEAAAAGLVAVAMNVGGVGELIAHERTGWLGNDVDELAYGLAQFLSDDQERERAGRRARLRVEHRHGAAALADRLEALYMSLVEEVPCAS